MSRAAIGLGAFGALASFAALHWVRMLVDPPLWQALGAVAVAAAAAAALLAAGRVPAGRGIRHLLAAAIVVIATASAMIVLGLRPALLAPGEWPAFADGIELGLAGIAEGVDYPYGGPNAWSRLTILLGLGLALVLAAALAFWPGEGRGRPRPLGLLVLIGVYTVAVAVHVPGANVARGLVLLLLVAAWLWLPALRRRSLATAAVVLLLAAAVAIPVTGRLGEGRAWVDYTAWSWAIGEGTGFDWEHDYGPIDWDRDGERMLIVRSEEPNYWKTSVLDRFDGDGWLRSGGLHESRELPLAAERDGEPRLNPDWTVTAEVTVDELRSDLVVGPGTARTVLRGIEGAEPSADGTVVRAPEILRKGDSYAVRAYVPDPSADQMRAADSRYSRRLSRFTAVELPDRAGFGPKRVVTLDRPGGRRDDAARGALLTSPYRRVYQLAAELAAGEPTPYDAVKAIENHLHDGYEYSETPPDRAYPLSAFLFVDEVGYCQQFSGAMALMLRMVGIPSRVATGFAPGEADGDARAYTVRDLDAHSWVEVYFNGIGWVPFDPTPPAAPAELQAGGELAASAGASSLGSLLALGSTAAEAVGGEGAGAAGEFRGRGAAKPGGGGSPEGGSTDPLLPLALIALLGLPGALVVASRARRLRRLDPEAEAAVRTREVEAALDGLGWGGGRTTLLGLERRVGSRPEPRAGRYLAKLRAARYGRARSPRPSRRERRALRRRLASGRGLGARLAAYRAMPPVSPRPGRGGGGM